MKISTKALVYIVVGVFVVCAIVYTFVAQRGSIGTMPTQSHVDVSDLTPQQILADMPFGFPMEGGVGDISGSATTTPDGGVEYKLFFNSRLSAASSEVLYDDYCLSRDWRVVAPKQGVVNQSPGTITCQDASSTFSLMFYIGNVFPPFLFHPSSVVPQVWVVASGSTVGVNYIVQSK